MPKILIIHSNKAAREFIEKLATPHHLVKARDSWTSGMKTIRPYRPDLLIAEVDPRSSAAMDMLRYLRRHHIRTPVILVGPAAAGVLLPTAMHLGASDFIEYPMEQSAFDQAISDVLPSTTDTGSTTPPVSAEEAGANLSELEKRLNHNMVCVAGKNQVYLQSLIQGGGRTSKPRVALKCPLRKQFGFPPDVYYEHIRDICCGDPSICEAFRKFTALNSA